MPDFIIGKTRCCNKTVAAGRDDHDEGTENWKQQLLGYGLDVMRITINPGDMPPLFENCDCAEQVEEHF